MLNWQAAVEVLWRAQIGQPQGNSIEALNNREFPLYEHYPDVCTYGHFSLIRRAFFFDLAWAPLVKELRAKEYY